MAVDVDPLAATDAPADRPVERLDTRELPAPQPLRRTRERLPDLPERTVLVQLSDRRPRHLFPKLDDREHAHHTVEQAAAVVTAVWREG